MLLDSKDQALLDAFRLMVREELARSPAASNYTATATATATATVGSMTVAEFAYVVRLSYEVVLRKIRSRSIAAEHVSKKSKVYRIKPSALAAFGISHAEAVERLATRSNAAVTNAAKNSPTT